MVKILSIFVAFLENMNFTQDVNGFGRMHSTSSQSPLTTTYKQPFHTKCLSLLGLSMFECCLIISNAIFILILMPMVFKISADVNDVRHDGLQEIKGTCVNNSNFTVYMLKVSKFQNENMKSSHFPKSERKNLKNSVLSIQGRIFQIFRSNFGQWDDFIFSF